MAQLAQEEALNACSIACKKLWGICVAGGDHLGEVNERDVVILINLASNPTTSVDMAEHGKDGSHHAHAMLGEVKKLYWECSLNNMQTPDAGLIMPVDVFIRLPLATIHRRTARGRKGWYWKRPHHEIELIKVAVDKATNGQVAQQLHELSIYLLRMCQLAYLAQQGVYSERLLREGSSLTRLPYWDLHALPLKSCRNS